MFQLNSKVIIHKGITGKIIEIYEPDKYFPEYRYKISYKTPINKAYATKTCSEGGIIRCL